VHFSEGGFQMQARRIFGLLGGGIVSVALFAGCGGTSTPKAAIEQDESDSAMQAVSADPSKGADAAGDPSAATDIKPDTP
jgi:hypothetical protein